MAAIVLTVVKATQDIISKGLVIHKQLMQAKKNKKGCVRLADRVKTVVDQLEGLANQGVNEELLQKALDEFKQVLEEAETLLKKYEETNWWKQKFNADTWRKDFEEVNKHLCIAAHHLSLSLQVEQRKNLEDMFNDLRIRKENGEDMKIDQQEWDKCKTSSHAEKSLASLQACLGISWGEFGLNGWLISVFETLHHLMNVELRVVV